jgi:murein DD-endopeptidase MepM/ murein hydrolase activator NlpD
LPRSTYIPAAPAPKNRRTKTPTIPARQASHAAPPKPGSVEAVLERGFGIFLDMKRRNLAIGAVAACGFLASVQALPAEADIIQDGVQVSTLQEFTAPMIIAAMPALARDDWAVSVFSLVQWPVPSATTMSSGFGPRSCSGCSSYHEGLDLNPGNGFPVVAIADGVVVESEFSGALGAHVVVQHIIDGQVVQSQYGHMQGDSLAVVVGQQVTIGQQLGLVGSTGQSTGPHLHFGIIIGGELVDPEPWLHEHANVAY